MQSSIGIRTAVTVYAGALKAAGHRALMARRDEVLQSFHDAVASDAASTGAVGIVRRTLSELWDLVQNRFAPHRRAVRISDAPSSPSPNRRGSSGVATDIRHSWRALAARKFDTSLTVGLLALGLATTGAVFGVADALLLHPVPFPHAERLAEIWSANPESRFSVPSMPRDLALRWLERTDLFAMGGAHTNATALVTDHGDPEVVPATRVSPGLFETLGVRPVLGRNFTPEEGHAGADHVAIIGGDVWSARFGRSPDVIGQTLRINAIDHRIVGVMADDFRYPYSKQRIWLPFEFRNPTPDEAVGYVTLTVRLQPGVTQKRATQEIETAGPAIARLASRPWKMSASPHFSDRTMMDTQTSRSIWLLFGATVLLMLTVCANVANLGLSQAFSRTRDAAIRSALGATRARMMRQTMIEQSVIGLLALAIAMPLTMGALKLAEALLPVSYTLASLNVLDIDWRLIVMMTSLALGAPLAAGMIPAIAGSRPSILGALKQEGRSVAGSRAARWYRKSLVVIEVACSVVLLISAAMLVRSFIKLQAVDKGFDTRNLVSVSLGFPSTYFGQGPSRDLYVEQALARVRSLPGVLAATSASGIPPENGGISFGGLMAEGATKPIQVDASTYEVQPDFFDTLGLRLVAGRALAASDSADQVVISDTMASRVFPGRSAIGARFQWEGDKTWMEVVGVAASVRESLGSVRSLPQIFSLIQSRQPSSAKPRDAIAEYRRIAVRVQDPASAIPQLRAELKAVNAGILVQSVDRVDDQMARDLDRPRFLLVLMMVFAGAGLLLTAAGVYGVLSCLVGEQLREYGIRLMLGASPSSISRTILLGGLGTTITGLVIGAAAAAMLGKTLSSVLFEVESRDAASYMAVAAILVAAAIAAAWRPARRARTVDPALLLRNE
jgi:putative ABC transport system permease protein